jgi:flagella synthesis protein FlgN
MHTQKIDPAESLQHETESASKLVDLLKQEQAGLLEADINRLSPLTEQKAAVVSRMFELASQRHHRLASLGFAADEQGMEKWLATPAGSKQGRKGWEQLLKLARSAKELNKTNGLLINRHMTRNQDAINALNLSVGGGNFYGPDGQSMNRPGSRNLVIG